MSSRFVPTVGFAFSVMLFVLLLTPLGAQEERPRVGVLEIENRTGESTYDSLAETVRQTVVLTLTLMDRYEVIDDTRQVAEDPSAQAAALPADALLWGEVSMSSAGEVMVSLTIFDRLEDDVVLSESGTAASLLDVFDTADEVVGRVIGSFSGVRVAFGSIRLDISGAGDYRVFLEERELGENVRVLERILTGEYRIRVEQTIGDEQLVVLDESVSVQSDTQERVAVALLDEGDVRLQRLRDLAARLDQALAAPAGPGTEDELDQVLARYVSNEPDPVTAEWYRYRVELEREYRSILDHRYFRDGEATFGDDLHRTLLAVTYELHREGDNPQGEESRFPEAQWQDLIERSRRNVGTFYGTMMLAADYQTILGNVEDQPLPYDILFSLNEDGFSIHSLQGGMTHRPYGAQAASRSMSRQYLHALERQRPLWQGISIGLGAAGVTTAGLIFGTGMPQNRIYEGDAAYKEYQATTDPDEAKDLREETQEHYDAANRLFLTGSIVGAVGVTALTTGVIARIRSVRRPQRIMESYLDEIGEARLDAALSFFEDRDRDRLVLVRSVRGAHDIGRQLRFGEDPAFFENGPAVYETVSPGTPVTWATGREGVADYTAEHVMHGGRNVLYIP